MTYGYRGSLFFYWYFIPYFRDVYRSEIEAQDLSSYQLFNQKNIKIYCHVGEDTFYDPVNDNVVCSSSNIFSNEIENEQICSIGSTYMVTPFDAEEWIDLILDIRTESNINFPIYIHNYSNYSIDEYSLPYVYTAGPNTYYFGIIEDFLSDADLTTYDNWAGRCIITHKAIPMNPNGWMISILNDDEYYINGWQLLTNVNDYNYYFNYSDTW